MWGVRTIAAYERIEQIGEGTYGCVAARALRRGGDVSVLCAADAASGRHRVRRRRGGDLCAAAERFGRGEIGKRQRLWR